MPCPRDTTFESLEAAAPVLFDAGLGSAFLVSDPWHNARSSGWRATSGSTGTPPRRGSPRRRRRTSGSRDTSARRSRTSITGCSGDTDVGRALLALPVGGSVGYDLTASFETVLTASETAVAAVLVAVLTSPFASTVSRTFRANAPSSRTGRSSRRRRSGAGHDPGRTSVMFFGFSTTRRRDEPFACRSWSSSRRHLLGDRGTPSSYREGHLTSAVGTGRYHQSS